jgi:hypothetical protein
MSHTQNGRASGLIVEAWGLRAFYAAAIFGAFVAWLWHGWRAGAAIMAGVWLVSQLGRTPESPFRDKR